jgi:hypothetical protein
MHLSDHDLRQMDEDWLGKLPEVKQRQVTARILQDFKEARNGPAQGWQNAEAKKKPGKQPGAQGFRRTQ